jgi:DNA polymerase-3 subunit epsilon
LLERARRPTFRICAENSPFDFNDNLKARDYRWNADGNTWPRAWYVDVAEESREAELEFLKREIYQGEVQLMVRRIDAHDRLSDRC